MTKPRSIKKTVNFLFEAGTLRKIARSHRQTLFTDDLSDNIASHSYRVTLIAYLLAIFENADVEKVIKMALFHDLDETRTNDMNWIHKKYVKTFDEEIKRDQLLFLGKDNEILKLVGEYEERKTLEAKITKDADTLDQFLILKEHAMTGNKEAKRWLRGRKNKYLSTNTAKKLAVEIQDQRPSEWWDNIWTNKRR